MTPLSRWPIFDPEARSHHDPPLGAKTYQGFEKPWQGRPIPNDGKVIRVPLRAHRRRRKELARSAKTRRRHEIVVRGFRRDANEELKKLKKDVKLTEDSCESRTTPRN